MLDALRFVAAAIAKKDYVPELTHFKIKDGRVTGYNGHFWLSSDIDVDLDIHPNAEKLLAAIRACEGTIALNMTPAGRLAVRSGKFRSYVECLPEQPQGIALPEGDAIDLGPNFLTGIKRLAPIMGIDASRPWAMGIKIFGQSMLATNNIMLVEYWHGTDLTVDIVIPSLAVNELLRIGEAPTKIQATDTSISFWFGEKRWMRSNLIAGNQWPTETVMKVMCAPEGNQTTIPEDLKAAVDTLKPFLGENGSLYLTPETISTSRHDGDGTTIDLAMPGVTETQAYHQKQLALLCDVAQTIDWASYPRPCMFRGERLRGAIVGQRV